MNNADIQGMFQTFRDAQVRYRSTGDTQQKVPADTARNAVEQYIADLQRTVQEREAEFRKYTESRVGTGNEVDQIANEARQVRENTNKIAGQYLVAQSQNQPIPIDWSQYYVKFAILGGLTVAAVAGAFVR
jgi:hypothetical protein